MELDALNRKLNQSLVDTRCEILGKFAIKFDFNFYPIVLYLNNTNFKHPFYGYVKIAQDGHRYYGFPEINRVKKKIDARLVKDSALVRSIGLKLRDGEAVEEGQAQLAAYGIQMLASYLEMDRYPEYYASSTNEAKKDDFKTSLTLIADGITNLYEELGAGLKDKDLASLPHKLEIARAVDCALKTLKRISSESRNQFLKASIAPKTFEWVGFDALRSDLAGAVHEVDGIFLLK